MVYTLEPLIAAVISSFILREKIGVNTVLGALCIVGSCMWSALELTPAIAKERLGTWSKSQFQSSK